VYEIVRHEKLVITAPALAQLQVSYTVRSLTTVIFVHLFSNSPIFISKSASVEISVGYLHNFQEASCHNYILVGYYTEYSYILLCPFKPYIVSIQTMVIIPASSILSYYPT
jgi:hypothetical protein